MNSYERYLKYFKSRLPRRSFAIEAGSGPVMISAPHSVEQTRAGRIKYGEYHTGVLARMLHDETGCHIIYKSHNKHDDANFDRTSPYRDALIDFVKQNGVRLVIDLHQMSAQRSELIEIGTGEGKNVAADPAAVDELIGCFQKRGFEKIVMDGNFPATYQNTVSASVSRECGIACIQIEFNTRLLSNEFRGCRYSDVLEALKEFIVLKDGINK